jgi:hypothetical protein
MARYVCEACGGSVSEEEYAAGKTTCATDGCAKKGQPFVRKEDGGTAASEPASAAPAAKKPWYKFW